MGHRPREAPQAVESGDVEVVQEQVDPRRVGPGVVGGGGGGGWRVAEVMGYSDYCRGAFKVEMVLGHSAG